MELKIKKFKELTNLELYKIIESRINVFVVEQNCAYHECDNLDQQSYHLFYLDQDQIVAYLRVIPPAVVYTESSFGRVLVKKEYRNRGLAKKLIQRAISFIENKFSKTNFIKISAQEYIVKLYETLGFRVVSDRYLDDNIPHYEMIYKL